MKHETSARCRASRNVKQSNMMREFLGNPMPIYRLTNNIIIKISQSQTLIETFWEPPLDLISEVTRGMEPSNLHRASPWSQMLWFFFVKYVINSGVQPLFVVMLPVMPAPCVVVVIQIKICAVCQEPGLRPIGRSQCVPDKSSLGLGSMSRFSAQILICFIAYIFFFFFL